MLKWSQFRQQQPDLAEAGRGLLCQFGVGLAFLGTISKSGAPRLHPIAPQLAGYGLYGVITPSPKLNDLLRNGRYALHSYPSPENEDAFYITGQAKVVVEPQEVAAVRAAYLAEPARKWDGPPADFGDQKVVEFLIETCLLTRTTGHGDFDPQHTVWRSG